MKLDPEERSIDPNKEMMLSAFNETTKQSGFYKLSLKDASLRSSSWTTTGSQVV